MTLHTTQMKHLIDPIKNNPVASSISILFLYLSPLLIFGEDSLVTIHDVLGSDHVVLKILAGSGQIFAGNNEIIPSILNGVPRAMFTPELDMKLWFHYFFGSYAAYAINQFFMHFIAFFGMYRLLKKNFIPEENHLIVCGVSCLYALLPFFATLGLAEPSQPLVLAAFLAIRENRATWVDWAALLLVPVYSTFYHVSVFLILLIGLLWLYDLLAKGDKNFRFFGAIFLMGAVSLLVNHRIIHAMFISSDFISHRLEFYSPPATLYTLYTSLKTSLDVFIWGDVNAKSLHGLIILPIVIVGLFLHFDKNIQDKRLPLLLIMIAIFSVVPSVASLAGPLKAKIDFLRTFKFHRFLYLNPMLWHIAFAISLSLLVSHARKGVQFVSICICLQLLITFFYHDEIQMRHGKPTYRQFYAEEMFSEITDYIGKKKKDYRVVSFGMHPMIANYSGFYTLDGYMGSYPMKHKHEFRKIIAKELEKDESLRQYFDWGGSRCYVFSSELTLGDWLYTKNRTVPVNNLELDTRQLRNMGGEYIFSAVKIENAEENNLKLLKIFDHENSAWQINLYEVIP